MDKKKNRNDKKKKAVDPSRNKNKRKKRTYPKNASSEFFNKLTQINCIKMAFLRSVATTATAAIATLAFSSSSHSHQSSNPPNTALSSNTKSNIPLRLVKTFATSPSPLIMDQNLSSQSQTDHDVLPELLTEYMVDMKCDGCVNAVKDKLQTINGIKNVEVDLSTQVVRILGSTPVKTMTEALEKTGRKARLIGQGVPEDFLISAAVSEFKGPEIFGVVRLAQVNMELARIEANFSGLSPGKHSWSINEFGDLTRGAASTGKVFNPLNEKKTKEPLGDLGTLDANEKGEAFYTGVKEKLRVADLIGRAIVVYATEDKSEPGIAAAVVARSAGVGENYKKLCTCDGTTIWEASDRDFVASKF